MLISHLEQRAAVGSRSTNRRGEFFVSIIRGHGGGWVDGWGGGAVRGTAFKKTAFILLTERRNETAYKSAADPFGLRRYSSAARRDTEPERAEGGEGRYNIRRCTNISRTGCPKRLETEI